MENFFLKELIKIP